MTHPIIGRERELSCVHDLVESRSSNASALFLVGPAGTGKTTLWVDGVERARDAGRAVLVARPYVRRRASPIFFFGSPREHRRRVMAPAARAAATRARGRTPPPRAGFHAGGAASRCLRTHDALGRPRRGPGATHHRDRRRALARPVVPGGPGVCAPSPRAAAVATPRLRARGGGARRHASVPVLGRVGQARARRWRIDRRCDLRDRPAAPCILPAAPAPGPPALGIGGQPVVRDRDRQGAGNRRERAAPAVADPLFARRCCALAPAASIQECPSGPARGVRVSQSVARPGAGGGRRVGRRRAGPRRGDWRRCGHGRRRDDSICPIRFWPRPAMGLPRVRHAIGCIALLRPSSRIRNSGRAILPCRRRAVRHASRGRSTSRAIAQGRAARRPRLPTSPSSAWS